MGGRGPVGGAATSLITIDRIAAGGDGVGRLPDGMTVFVPRSAPGDVLELDIVSRRSRFARGAVRRVDRPGPDRVDPPCPHYTRDHCGGCQLQHLSLAAQLEAKRTIVGDALRRLGGKDVGDPEIVPADDPWRYRTKITLAAAGSLLGLHPHDRPEEVFRLDDCLITNERLMQLWARIRPMTDRLPRDIVTLVLRLDREGELHVLVESEQVWNAGPVATAVDDPAVHFWWKPVGGAARVVAGRRTGFPVRAFEQIQPRLADRIRTAALDALGPVAGKTVWDLYGGVGDGAGALARAGATVWSVDADPSATAWARRRFDHSSIVFVTGLVEESLHRLPPPDAVIVNPPRAGLHERVASRLEEWGRTRPGALLAYVSCDPATLARDLKRMPSLALQRLTAFDLFPQTSHVEVLAVVGSS